MTTAVPYQQSASHMPPRMAPQPVLTSGMPGDISGFQHLGYVLLIGYLFLIYSRVFDVKLSFLHIPGIAFRIIVAMLILGRAFLPGLKHPIGKGMYFLTAWFIIACPFSIWRGGSVEVLKGAWLPAFATFLATSGLLVSFQQCRKAIYTVAVGLCTLTLIAVVYGTTEETGRLFLPQGKFANPNELAQALCMGLPLAWLMIQESKSAINKAAAGGMIFVMLLMISKCGSRGALITLLVLLLVIFFRASIMGKTKLVMAMVALCAILLALMPGKLLRRYKTLDEADEQTYVAGKVTDYDEELETSAATSAQRRRDLLKRSIKYTLQHPLFGVGPGNYTVAEDADMRAQGFRKGTWQGTHNSYTQVSSEEGIPALIAYVFVILVSMKKTLWLVRRTQNDPRLRSITNCAVALNCCMVVYAVSVFFDYIAYTSMLSVFAGLCMALDVNAHAEIERLTAQPGAPPPIPFTQFRASLRRPAGVPQEA
jgi:O-antigen ligase